VVEPGSLLEGLLVIHPYTWFALTAALLVINGVLVSVIAHARSKFQAMEAKYESELRELNARLEVGLIRALNQRHSAETDGHQDKPDDLRIPKM
jgi:hypothetical protein